MTENVEDSRTKRDHIVRELRRRVLVGEYERGSRLRQDELAETFGVSITPVREALRILESERLVVSEPHKGVRVAGIDLDRVEAIYVMRRLVESFAMRRATIRMSLRDLAKQRSLLERMEQGEDALDIREANRAFHFGFYDRCGMPELSRQIDALWDAFPWDLVLGEPQRAQHSQEEHGEMLAAVERGDADGAARALEAHIAHGYEATRAAIAGGLEMEDPFEESIDSRPTLSV